MARKRIAIQLTPDEHKSLSTYVAHGHKSAREINRARILLLAHDGRTDPDIAKVLGVSRVTVYNMRKRYHHKGEQHILDVLHDEPRAGRPIKFDSTVEAKVTMIACSDPPQGLHAGRCISSLITWSNSTLWTPSRMRVSEDC